MEYPRSRALKKLPPIVQHLAQLRGRNAEYHPVLHMSFDGLIQSGAQSQEIPLLPRSTIFPYPSIFQPALFIFIGLVQNTLFLTEIQYPNLNLQCFKDVFVRRLCIYKRRRCNQREQGIQSSPVDDQGFIATVDAELVTNFCRGEIANSYGFLPSLRSFQRSWCRRAGPGLPPREQLPAWIRCAGMSVAKPLLPRTPGLLPFRLAVSTPILPLRCGQ